MAEKLSVQIALEGGAEVEKQLADIGKAGQQAFAQIEKSATQVGGFKNLKPEVVTAQLKKMGVEGTAAVGKIQAAVATAVKFENLVVGVQSVEAGFAAVRTAAVAAAPVIAGIGVLAAGAFIAAQKSTIAFAQSIAKISAEAIKLGLSFQEFDAARLRLEKLGISAEAISAGFQHVQQFAERMRLERVARDAETVKNGFAGSDAALKRLKTTAQEFTAAGDAAAKALRSLGITIPGLNEDKIRKYGIELTKLEALVKRLTGRKIDLEFFLTANPAEQLEAIKEILTALPDGAERTAAALRLLGPALGTETIQKLRLMEGSLSPIEANALRLTGAINRLQAALARLGSTAFAPGLTTAINAATAAVEAFQTALDKPSFETFTTATGKATAALQYFSFSGQQAVAIKFLWDLGGFNSLIDKLAQAGRAWLEYFGIVSKAGGTPLPGGAPIGGPGGGHGHMARGGLLGGRGTGTSDSNLAWLSRGEYIMPANAVRQSGVLGFLEAVRRSGRIPGFASGGLVGGGGTSAFGLTLDNMAQAIQKNTEAINSQSTVIMELGRIVGGLAQEVSSLVQTVGSMSRKAGGGLLGGRGTGTSDSNLAWVSRGEHVMPARAVRQPGVLMFLEALRRSGGNLADVLDGMGRFALGGMVPRAIPAFAGGGMVGGGGNLGTLTLGLPGGGSVTVRASSGVAEQLHRAAALAQVRSGGRKPSRYS